MSKKKFQVGRGYSKDDWDAVESPPLTRTQMSKGKPFAEAFPDLHGAIKRSVGRPKLADATIAVTIRVKPETLKKFQATGKGWRARMAEALDQPKKSKKQKAA